MQAQAPTRLAIVSDDRIFVDGLAPFLSEQPDFAVTTYCPAPDVTIAQLGREHDIVLLDARDETASGHGRAIAQCGVVIFIGPAATIWSMRILGEAGARRGVTLA